MVRVLRPDGFALLQGPKRLAAECGSIDPPHAADGDGLKREVWNVSSLARAAVTAGFSRARVIEGLNRDVWLLLLMPFAQTRDIADLMIGEEFSRVLMDFDATDDVAACPGRRGPRTQ